MKICLIIPYFGKFPNYFDLWLESVKYNKEIDFLLVTDNEENYDFPENIIVKKTTFREFVEIVQRKFDFKISLKRPYKICDYKGAYGEIFSNELEGYDFWGHCDVDLIFGNIKKYITNYVLENNEHINLHGHLSLYRNNEKINTLYKTKYVDLLNYKQAFTSNWIYHFDEYPGISYITKRSGVKYVDIEDYADIDRFSFCFRKVYDNSQKQDDYTGIKQIFKWKQGKLIDYILTEGDLTEKEVMYVHLQKRKMEVNNNIVKEKGFYIVPNEFININEEKIEDIIQKYCVEKEYHELDKFKKECFRQRFRLDYWRMKIIMLFKRK